ncbi:MAG: glycerophosphodiester phosphodiesterase family protein [Eubacteriales bacterium]|nr:glycerophosphodiester phosphodiesterase family protein [Eubacteriales bacterium]
MLIIAHRSGPGVFPEQSILSAREALKNGADIVEMDVRETKDGVPVICHDDDTGRMFGVPGDVADWSLREFMAMRHVGDRAFAPHSLEDVLACGVRPLLLHCKQTGEEQTERICALLMRYRAAETTTLGVQDPSCAPVVRRCAPGCRILAFMPRPEQIEEFGAMEIDYIRLWEHWLTPERVGRVHATGKKLWIMANDPAQGGCGYTTAQALRSFAALGAHAVLLNDIPWAAAHWPGGQA